MRKRHAAALFALAALHCSAPASAQAAEPAPAQIITKTMGQLLADGYQIHSVTIIDEQTARRMSGDNAWKDDVMFTLVKGGDFALCHYALSIVTTGIGLKNGPCNIAQ